MADKFVELICQDYLNIAPNDSIRDEDGLWRVSSVSTVRDNFICACECIDGTLKGKWRVFTITEDMLSQLDCYQVN